MSHPSTHVNGCSLEDCHTNLFALTDLDDIHWQRLQRCESKEADTYSEPTDDPVLQSFVDLVKHDILCVWRRIYRNTEQQSRPTDQLNCGKELWLFWYGSEEPKHMRPLISPQLKETDSGSWKNGGLSYECRTLLFKALHNLIERCLYSQNFVRLGMWFVQPYDFGITPALSDKSTHLCFKFSFFLHGESQVCASIDVRQHAPLRRLQPYHLQLATQGSGQGIQVILAPYGLAGVVTGQTYRHTDLGIQRLMEDWHKFYYMQDFCEFEQNKMPPAVEVLVGGARMKYPSTFVLVTAETEAELIHRNPNCVVPPASLNPSHQTTTAVTSRNSSSSDNNVKIPAPPPDPGLEQPPTGVPKGQLLGSRVLEKVWQDCCVTCQSRHQAGSGDGPEENNIGTWDFSEPLQKQACHCSKGKKQRIGGSKSNTSSANSTRLCRSAVSFHRRSTLSDDILLHEVDLVSQRIHPTFKPTLPTPSAPASGSNMSRIRGNGDAGGDAGVDSPHSNAPSPLVSSSHPSDSAQNADPTMPTLSPHPPPKPLENGVPAAGNKDQHGGPNNNSVNSSCAAPGESHLAAHPTGTANEGLLKTAQIKTEPFIGSEVTVEPVTGAVSPPFKPLLKSLKRPVLTAKNYEEVEDFKSDDIMYNYESLNAWLECPLKKQRLNFSRGSSTSPLPDDPYKFSDDTSEKTAANNGGFRKRDFRSSQDSYTRSFNIKSEDDVRRNSDTSFSIKEEKSSVELSPDTPGQHTMTTTFTEEKDLIPSLNDLDNLFEESSDGSDNDGQYSRRTPPMEQKNLEESRTKLKDTKNIEDMYPTPPSNHHDLLPCTGIDSIMEGTTDLQYHHANMFTKCQDRNPYSASLESSVKDWSYVFKPKTVNYYESSSHFAPIELPSAKLPQLFMGSPSKFTYKPVKQFSMPLQPREGKALVHTQPNPHYSSHTSLDTQVHTPRGGGLDRMASIDASPATFGASQRTPMSYDLQSPASNASSYLNKTLGSVETGAGTNSQLPEVHSLVVTIMLSDSVLNLFKDHNFHSCTICVCNKNIRGSDVGQYLPDKTNDEQYKCTCGFSAVMNRRFGAMSGLFYEDEVDITGIRDDRYEHHKPSLLTVTDGKDGAPNKTLPGQIGEIIPQEILLLLQSQFSSLFPSMTALYQYAKKKLHAAGNHAGLGVNLQYQDGQWAAQIALEAGRQAVDNYSNENLRHEDMAKSNILHQWPYLQASAKIPSSSQDLVLLLTSLQPLLQEIKKRAVKIWAQVSGPLSWKDFHLLAGRGDESSEPQQIPPVIVGHEKDWLSLAPQAVQYWDKLFLEPYGKPRDIAYLILCPENDFIVSHVVEYFRELSTTYELCRLGRHVQLTTKLRDGIMRVGKKSEKTVGAEEVDPWFTNIGTSSIASKLKLYAQVCRHQLGPFLRQQKEKELENCFSSASPAGKDSLHMSRPEPSPAPPPTPESGSSQSGTDERGDSDGREANKENYLDHDTPDQHIDREAPALIIYIIDPFTYAEDWADPSRLAMLGILRCYQELLSVIPSHQNIHLQVVPLQTVIDYKGVNMTQHFKMQAMAVYTQSRRIVSHSIIGRSLTGLGPASAAELILKNQENTLTVAKIHSPPYILSRYRENYPTLPDKPLDTTREQSTTLICGYCLSEDQRWLLASVTDSHGELLETCTINIHIPNRSRRQKTSARSVALNKFWDFIVGVMSTIAGPWRLVIGRFGRLGHGELIGWAELLSRKNLARVSKQLREMCNLCNVLGNHDIPCVLSACLISMEVHPSIHIMPDSIKVEDRQSSKVPLHTPQDASATHILVFPTSATARANSGAAPQETNSMFLPDDDLPEEDEEFMPIDNDLMGEFDDIITQGLFDTLGDAGGMAAGLPSGPGSPTHGLGGGGTAGRGQSTSHQESREDIQLLQQPLAMGFYVSTAPTGPLPKWFWTACPQREGLCPSCFKAALHINVPTVQQGNDEEQVKRANKQSSLHPLDSNLTCDVLRYVLETYNALSWLTIDPSINERRSCLPVHLAILMQLYHALDAFV